MKNSSEKPSIVIIGNHTQGLGIIRSAKECKMPIFVLNDLMFSSSRYSKYLSSYIKIPKGTIKNLAVNIENQNLMKILLNLPVKYPSLLMGVNEDIINYIFNNSIRLSEKYFIPQNAYNIIFDKYEFNNLLKEENKVPTYLLKDIDIDNYFSGNYILKSRLGNKLRNLTAEKALVMNDNSELEIRQILENFNRDELIIQKIIDSKYPIMSSCAFSVEGKILGLFQYEKIRQHPNQFGTGTYLKSIFDEKIFNISKEILLKLKYTGISEIEFIVDEETNVFKAIEMNPRTWKSINFSTECGQNLVLKYANFIMEKEINSELNFHTDYYWVDLFTDIPQMFREKKIFKYSSKKMYECMWDKSDPLPFIFTILLSPFILLKI